MKRLFLFLSVSFLLASCSKQQIVDFASLASDLNAVASNATARGRATVTTPIDLPVDLVFTPPTIPVAVDSMSAGSANSSVPSITYPTDEELTATLDELQDELVSLLEKYDKLDELDVFSELEDIEQYVEADDSVVYNVNVDGILKKCTTDRYQTLHYDIINKIYTPTIQVIADDPSLKLFEKVILAEMIGYSCVELDGEIEEDPSTRTTHYYNHASTCTKVRNARIKNCNFNYQMDEAVSYICAIGMSVGNLFHLIGHVALDKISLAREAERKRDRCIHQAKDDWADCIAHAPYD